MDLGLTDEDIAGLQAKSDMDASGSTEWEEFLPIGCELIRGGGLSLYHVVGRLGRRGGWMTPSDYLDDAANHPKKSTLARQSVTRPPAHLPNRHSPTHHLRVTPTQ